jgi:hypothetical protein
MWSAQRHLVIVAHIAGAFRDGIDRVYIDYTRAAGQARLDTLAANRVLTLQSFLTNHLQAVHTNAWQAFEILRVAAPIASRQAAIQFADYLLARVVVDLDLVERYEYHNGNMYDNVSSLARRSVLLPPNTDIGVHYGTHFAPLLQRLRQELDAATQALQHLKRCGE